MVKAFDDSGEQGIYIVEDTSSMDKAFKSISDWLRNLA